jgi:hypothetical protein
VVDVADLRGGLHVYMICNALMRIKIVLPSQNRLIAHVKKQTDCMNHILNLTQIYEKH